METTPSPAGNTTYGNGPAMKEKDVKTASTGHEDSGETLKHSEKKLRQAFSCGLDVIIITNQAMKITAVTPSVEALLGYRPEELLNVLFNQLRLFTPPSLELIMKNIPRVLAGEPVQNHVCEFITRDGNVRIAEVTLTPVRENGEITGTITVARDITEHKDMEERLCRLEEQYRDILDTIPDGYFEIDLSGKYTFANDVICAHLQRTREELIGKDNREFQTAEDAQKAFRLFRNVYKTGIPEKAVELEILSKDGSARTYELSVSLIKDAQETPVGFRGISRDITERKRMEEELIKSEVKYRTIVENAQEGIFQASADNRSLTLNRTFAGMLGYSCTEEAAREIINTFQQNFVNPDEYRKVLETIRQRGSIKGYEAELYRRDKSRIWVNISVTAMKDPAGNLLYYHGIVEDITPQKKLEQERQKSIDSLRKSLGATIKALSAISEARDQYTAGHQRRVSDLARAIATEMKLSPDRIDGIRLAGMIHDMGKIAIPSEILTKPTKLTNLEMEIIKTHAEAGYDILKGIEFPWPIARMVREHHERINGSGYPRGLKDNDILLESKIIAVADVVEAISSHRPYRPALGILVALEEIEHNSGIFYDKTASEACLKLFREKRYTMPE
jgi:PAS domain S-box-containing protein